MAEAPLTCLACHQSPVVVGVGTIDGDVLVYDLRGSRTPLWKHRVATRKPLVSIDFAFEQSAMPVATGRRPSGVTMRSSVRKSGGSSDDSGIGSDHRRARPTAAPPSSRVVGREPRATGTRSTEPTQRDSVRPPHNPAIKAHHRQVLNQLLESAHKKEPRSEQCTWNHVAPRDRGVWEPGERCAAPRRRFGER
ncbi:hypothetical protein DL89DRAFT_20895 [Linderina pennispora]|uniref:WD40 repeat-like protein n=1 Tax=Linderina pennispora TaxID=61395 RepID=A0A1Y1WMS5_9FUNG|nr:uncharacterized protein DL89DRAFT_20895 [Linderina pennispora]ORX74665.1 hypothetical protein DL89DRAFT_20895 [Linderina pennispora]